MGEQGLGDEIMFSNILPDAQAAVGETGKLQICVDPRMVALYQRSYPKAEVGTYDDRTLIDNDGNKALRLMPFASKDNKPDLWAPMGTALQYYRKSLADFPRKPFLVPDPAAWRSSRNRLATLPGKKVGICWRSMMMGAKRAKYFSPIDGWGAILKTPGISFVNLQYGDSAAEIARAKEKFGVTIHQMEGLDLKQDIDGTAALCRRSIWCCRRPPRRPIPRPAWARRSGFSAPAWDGRSWERTNIPGTPIPASSGRKNRRLEM